MNWQEVLAIVGAIFVANMGVIIPMFLWLRSEGNSDRRQMQQEGADYRKEILQLIRNIQEEAEIFRKEMRQETEIFRQTMAQESKDFHGRLCAIEERRVK